MQFSGATNAQVAVRLAHYRGFGISQSTNPEAEQRSGNPRKDRGAESPLNPVEVYQCRLLATAICRALLAKEIAGFEEVTAFALRWQP